MSKKIKIGGFEYIIEEVEGLGRDRGALGESCGNNLTISIDDSVKEEVKLSTIFHEVIEQINYINELELEHNAITVLGNALFQVMLENKDLLDDYFNYCINKN